MHYERAALLSGVKRDAGEEAEGKRGKSASRRRAMNIGSYTVARESARRRRALNIIFVLRTFAP